MTQILAVAKIITLMVWFLALSTLFVTDMEPFRLIGTGVLSFLVVAHSLECIIFWRSSKFNNTSNRALNSLGVFLFGAFHLIPLWTEKRQQA